MKQCDVVKARDLASQYLEQRPQLNASGVVILFEGQAVGWMNVLRDPSHWEPGCLAVDGAGAVYKAVGGNVRDGAKSWQLVSNLSMTPDVRNQKKTNMRLRFKQACEAWSTGDYELAAYRVSQVSDMAASYMRTDSHLYWYGIRLIISWGEFTLQDDTRDFDAWAVGQACIALRAAA